MSEQQHLADEECRQPKHWCSACRKWILGEPTKEPYNDMRFLSGSRGVKLIASCGHVVGRLVEAIS